MHTKNIHRPRVEKRTPRVSDGQRHPVIVRTIPLLALAVLLLTPAPANAERLEPADRMVRDFRVTYVEPSIRNTMYVELNDGSTWRLPPCRVEDGRSCYWDADTRGNHRGTSFVNVRGTVIHTWRI